MDFCGILIMNSVNLICFELEIRAYVNYESISSVSRLRHQRNTAFVRNNIIRQVRWLPRHSSFLKCFECIGNCFNCLVNRSTFHSFAKQLRTYVWRPASSLFTRYRGSPLNARTFSVYNNNGLDSVIKTNNRGPIDGVESPMPEGLVGREDGHSRCNSLDAIRSVGTNNVTIRRYQIAEYKQYHYAS